MVLLLFFVYFQNANASFTARSIPPEALRGELARWGAWHWFRTGLGMLAFAAGIVGVRAGRQNA